MRALRIAISLVLVPRLFATLFLIPLLLSLLFVYFQLIVTGLFIRATDREPEAVARTYRSVKSNNLGRRLLYGNGAALPPLKICRWHFVHTDDGREGEAPPSECATPDRLDVALQVKDPATYNPQEYEKIFDGNVERLHLCISCRPDIVIHPEETPVRTDVYSVWGSLVLHLVRYNDHVQEQYLAVASDMKRIQDMLGDIYLNQKGFAQPALLSSVKETMAIVFNIASLIVISLWLALKAHRKVLDYFARSGALLPMVAASGKKPFYLAIWILTLLRVAAFLLAAVPMTVKTLLDVLGHDAIHFVYAGQKAQFGLWLIATVASLSLATLIASIADLKQRHSLLSFTYKYVPIGCAALGGLIWSATFLFDTNLTASIRATFASLPVFGMVPVMLAPLFEPGLWVLCVHALLTVTLLVVSLHYNAQWFAAHLEDL